MGAPFVPQEYWRSRYKKFGRTLRTVGRKDCSIADNHASYVQAQAKMSQSILRDFAGRDLATCAALDLGCGLGTYASLLARVGFGRYLGIDFIPPVAPPGLPPSYEFRCQKIADPLPTDEQFDLILAIDVLYHVIDDAEFERTLALVIKHSRGFVYATGIFEDAQSANHVRQRSMLRHAVLGPPRNVGLWRDNVIATFLPSHPPSK